MLDVWEGKLEDFKQYKQELERARKEKDERRTKLE
jgi:hypothetical protein